MPAFREGKANGIPPSHYLHELPAVQEERLEKLFRKLDLDGNGKVDVHDLSEALRGIGIDKRYAEKFLTSSDRTKSGDIGLAEFLHYVREHEKNLSLQFSNLDKNKDGKIDLEELIRAFKDIGIRINRDEATKLLQRMDKDGNLAISFDEWRDFLLYAPSASIHELVRYWRHSTYMDIGEDVRVPDDFSNSEIVSGMWWRHLLAGGIAGGVSRTCTAPLDRIKVYLQVHGTRHCSIASCFRYMMREGGVTSLWRGNGINVLKIGPETALKFMAYEEVKRKIKGGDDRDLEVHERFVAGSLAGSISQSAIYPLEVLKTRLALRKTGEFGGIADAARRIYKHGGLKSFYRGYVPNLIGIIPYAGIDLAVYETLKNTYLQFFNVEDQPAFWLVLICGTLSSTSGQLFSYPLALVRTKLQAEAATTTNSRSTMCGVISDIIAKQGFRGLFRGITPNFLKVAPAVSISYMVYEEFTQALGVNMT